MRCALILFCFFLFVREGFGQALVFRPVVGHKKPEWDTKEYLSAVGERWHFSLLSFYLSDFSWYGRRKTAEMAESPDSGSRLEVHQPQRVELLQFGPETDSLRLEAPFSAKRVCFRIGLDSATQVSGRTDGALDPALGMYWAWNTGYIQCRLEGFSPDSKGKKGRFEFHIGGYARPYACDTRVCLNFEEAVLGPVFVDLKSFSDAVSLKKYGSVLTPGPEAFFLAGHLPAMFRTSEKIPAGLPEKK